MQSIVTLLLIPFIILNTFAGIVGGIWLIIRGDWSTLLVSLLISFSGVLIISLCLAPGLLLMLPTMRALEKGWTTVGALFGLSTALWTQAVLACWCVLVYTFIVSSNDASLPYMLTGYATAIGPWAYLASKEQHSNDWVSLLFAQIGTMLMMVATWIDNYDLSWQRMASWSVPAIAVGIIVQLLAVVDRVKRNKTAQL